MNRTICRKIGDYDPEEHPSIEECIVCEITDRDGDYCPIKVLINRTDRLLRKNEAKEIQAFARARGEVG